MAFLFQEQMWLPKCSKFQTPKKKEHPKFIFSIASLCKIGYFPHRIFGIFLLEIKILLYEFLEF